MPELDSDLQNDVDQTSDELDDNTTLDDGEDVTNEDETEGTDDGTTTDDGKADDADNTDESVDFPDWAKQYGLPDDIKSEEDLAEQFIALSKKVPADTELSPDMKRVDDILKAQGVEGGVQALIDGRGNLRKEPEPVNTEAKDDAYFQGDQFNSYIEGAIKNGLIKDEHVAGYKSSAQFNDAVLNPLIKRMNEAMGGLANIVRANRASIGNISFKSVEKLIKGSGVTKDALDAYMVRNNLTDYEKALPIYAMQENPKLFQHIQENAKQKGINSATKKLKRNSSIRRGKGSPATVPGFDHKKYTNADGTISEAVREILDLDEQEKVILDFEKWSAKQRK